MARPIVFTFSGQETSFDMQKVDRSKLYGYKELEVLDDDGTKCEMATLAEDGRTLIGRGGTGIGYLSADGLWCEKDELKPVNLDGDPITPVKSSFSAPIELANEVTVDEYMDHRIRLVYRLELDDEEKSEASKHDAVLQKIRDGAIFKFDYSYRGGLDADAGFLIANHEGEVFMVVGDETTIQYVGLPQAAPVAVEEEPLDDDDMDFGMI